MASQFVFKIKHENYAKYLAHNKYMRNLKPIAIVDFSYFLNFNKTAQ